LLYFCFLTDSYAFSSAGFSISLVYVLIISTQKERTLATFKYMELHDIIINVNQQEKYIALPAF